MKYCLSITEVMTVDIRMNIKIDWMKIHPTDPINSGMGYSTVSASCSMEQYWKAILCSASQEIPTYYGTRKYITVCTRARYQPLF
jgi:hypothetical protein